MKFAWIRDHCGEFEVRRMCRVLAVSKAGFYAWARRSSTLSDAKRRRERLRVAIRQVHIEHRSVYGSPRVHAVLQSRGERVSRKTVASIMRRECIRGRVKRKSMPRTTDSRHAYRPASNVLNRRFAADRPNRKWVADITYIATDGGWLYVAAVLDLCSRRIVGWAMARHMKADLVADALRMAIEQRTPEPGLLHHSDRGVQYACDQYQHLLGAHQIECSMSGKGNCYDNAAMESFWSTLKTEHVYQTHYATPEQAKQSIFEYIEVFYNRVRLHSTLGYVSPESFEAGRN
jgi:putative transposase